MVKGILKAVGGVVGVGIAVFAADALFADARALAERTGELRSLALLEGFYSAIKLVQGDVPSLVKHAVEGLRLAEQTGDPILIGALTTTQYGPK